MGSGDTGLSRGGAPVVALVVPCLDEREALPVMVPRFASAVRDLAERGEASARSRVLIVDDGSSDGTWDVVERAARDEAPYVMGLGLARNLGQQRALFAGLMEARGHVDVAVTLDCDGQDDVSAIPRMLAAYRDGAQVVYGVRGRRDGDTVAKRVSARLFYRAMGALRGGVVFDHADFRLMAAPVLDALAAWGDGEGLFLRGVVPRLGFPGARVEYDRGERVAGETHYSLRKMASLAVSGLRATATPPKGARCASCAHLVERRVGSWEG